MKKLLGNEVDVFLKFDGDVISGILFDIEDECVYIQKGVEVIIVVPKENIKYYASKTIDTYTKSDKVENQTQEVKQSVIDALDVYVDQVFITKIPVPPTFDLSNFSDNIMKITLGNPDVQAILVSRTQKSVEYFPGRIHIITDGENYTTPSTDIITPNPIPPQDSFVMSSSGSPVSTYLNPSQMVSRLNKVVKKKPEEKQNDE